MKPALVLSCEHGGNGVPPRYRPLFSGAGHVLRSHRAWDPGALVLARELARALEAPLVACTVTRLLADPNRSAHHAGVFSEWTRGLPTDERDALLDLAWRPHRATVEALVGEHVAARRPVVHVSVHSFTPRWKGRTREIDVALLYDPARPRERAFAGEWLAALRARRPGLRLRRNQPYRGSSDGLTTALRARFRPRAYLGIELEVSQRFPLGPAPRWRALRRDLRAALSATLEPAAVARWAG